MLSPSDIISKHPWRSALFLTYPLSLSFYESQLHKEGLHRRGCRDIRIVCDPDGYGMCLSERRSSRVGAEYRVSVAALPKGVFHPKVVLLEGESESVLMVGSGNLTFGGFGRNVEVLDAIHSSRHPGMFASFAAFLRDLSRHPNLILTDRQWIDEWGTRLGRFDLSSPTGFPRLLHNAAAPLADQLAAEASARGGASLVRSLAPFHDPDGEGIIQFAETCGADNLVVGVLASAEGAPPPNSPFPFHNHAPTSVRVEAAAVIPPAGSSNKLHAKWLEIVCRDGTTLVVTGSLNATTQSLHTTRNIELVTLRLLTPGAEPLLAWIPCPPPAGHDRPDYHYSGLGERILVQASLTREGSLSGRMLARSSPTGPWEVALVHPSGPLFTGTVTADETGRFSFPVPDPAVFVTKLGVQIELHQGDRMAFGWVEVAPLLAMNRRSLLGVATLARLLSGQADPDDVTELVSYLAAHAEEHLAAFTDSGAASHRHRHKAQADADRPAPDRSVPLSTLFRRDSVLLDHAAAEAGADESAFLTHILTRIRQRLLSPSPEDSAPSDDGDDGETEEEEDEDRAKAGRARERHKASLQDFNRRMEDLIRQLAAELPRRGKPGGAASPQARVHAGARFGAACALWLEGNLFGRGPTSAPSDETGSLARRWFSTVTSKIRASEAGEACRFHALTVALALACRALHRHTFPDRWALSVVRSALERFLGGDAAAARQDLDEVAGEDGPKPIFEKLLKPEMHPRLPECVGVLLGIATVSDQLARLTSPDPATRHQAASDDSLPLWSLASAAPLRALIRDGRRTRIAEARPTDTHCPACHMLLPLANQNEIRSLLTTRCTHSHCSAFLLATSPSD